MSSSIVLIVLFSALLHASWNAAIKTGHNRLYNTMLISLGASLVSVIVLPWLAMPAAASWPFIALSVAVHIVYFLCMYRAYETGDMSQVYPIMRGTPPLLIAIASAPLLGEPLSVAQWLAVVVISLGIFLIAFGQKGGLLSARQPLAWALLTALLIAIYTGIDGTGVRLSRAPVAYTLWMLLLTSVVLNGSCLILRGREFVRYARTHTRIILIGGPGSLAAYTIALWAMTHAPVAPVAALRETSIVFAAVIAAWLIKERLGIVRWLAIAIILAGVVMLRLA